MRSVLRLRTGRAAFLAGAVLLTPACGGDDSGPTASTTMPAVTAETTVRTEGTDVSFTAPTTPTIPSTTTTTEATGLPELFPIPANGILTLGGDSTMIQSVGIRGVPQGEVHTWLVGSLGAAGYTITADTPERVAFTGDGVSGTAEIIPTADDVDEITVRFTLGA